MDFWDFLSSQSVPYCSLEFLVGSQRIPNVFSRCSQQHLTFISYPWPKVEPNWVGQRIDFYILYSVLGVKTLFGQVSKVSEFFHDGPVKEAHCNPQKSGLVRHPHPQLINMNHYMYPTHVYMVCLVIVWTIVCWKIRFTPFVDDPNCSFGGYNLA